MQSTNHTHWFPRTKTDVAVALCLLVWKTTKTQVEEVIVAESTTGKWWSTGNTVGPTQRQQVLSYNSLCDSCFRQAPRLTILHKSHDKDCKQDKMTFVERKTCNWRQVSFPCSFVHFFHSLKNSDRLPQFLRKITLNLKI